MPAIRADVVGSLLRPPELLAAQAARAEGRMAAAQYKAVEDRAVDAAVAGQEAAGLPVVTDGEMRRLSFQSQMTAAVEGFAGAGLEAFVWGEWRSEELGEWHPQRPDDIDVVAPLRRRRSLSAEELVYLRARTVRTPKVTLPSPSLFANFWSSERSSAIYPTLDAFLADVCDILREEVAELAGLGARYIQIDAPHYALLLDPRTRRFYEERGGSAKDWLARGLELDNALIEGYGGITFGFHLCRGNQASRWLVAGGYDSIARTLFGRIRAERLLLEYDDARSGTFEPLRLVPDDKVVVLGLVTTKTAELESVDTLCARVHEAARYMPLERLAISPQCGFSTSVLGNQLSIDDQQAKLARVVETAEAVWGSID